jgi:hypothetical protein
VGFTTVALAVSQGWPVGDTSDDIVRCTTIEIYLRFIPHIMVLPWAGPKGHIQNEGGKPPLLPLIGAAYLTFLVNGDLR